MMLSVDLRLTGFGGQSLSDSTLSTVVMRAKPDTIGVGHSALALHPFCLVFVAHTQL